MHIGNIRQPNLDVRHAIRVKIASASQLGTGANAIQHALLMIGISARVKELPSGFEAEWTEDDGRVQKDFFPLAS